MRLRRAAAAAFVVVASARIAAAEALVPVARLALPDGVRMRTIAFSADGALAAVQGSDGRARLYALPSGELRATLESGDVGPVALSPDGRFLAAGSRRGSVSILETQPGAAPRVVTASGPRASRVIFSPDGTLLAVARGGAPAQLFEAASGKLRGALPADFGGSMALAFSPDGKWLAAADEDTTVRVYATDTAALRTKIDIGPLDAFTLDFTPDGRALVAAGAEKTLLVLDPAAGSVRRLPKGDDPVGAVAVLADGKSAAAATFHADLMTAPAPLLVWDLESGERRVVAPEIRVAGGGVTRDRTVLVATVDGGVIVVSKVR